MNDHTRCIPASPSSLAEVVRPVLFVPVALLESWLLFPATVADALAAYPEAAKCIAAVIKIMVKVFSGRHQWHAELEADTVIITGIQATCRLLK